MKFGDDRSILAWIKEQKASRSGKRADAPSESSRSRSAPVMGSNANILDQSTRADGSFDSKKFAKNMDNASKAKKARDAKSPPASEPVSNPNPASSQTAGVKGSVGTQSGPSAPETANDSTPVPAAEPGKNILEYPSLQGKDNPTTTYGSPDRTGLFGEKISQENWDKMTQANKEAGFYSKFADGGQVKKVAGGPKSVSGGPQHCEAMRFHK